MLIESHSHSLLYDIFSELEVLVHKNLDVDTFDVLQAFYIDFGEVESCGLFRSSKHEVFGVLRQGLGLAPLGRLFSVQDAFYQFARFSVNVDFLQVEADALNKSLVSVLYDSIELVIRMPSV